MGIVKVKGQGWIHNRPTHDELYLGEEQWRNVLSSSAAHKEILTKIINYFQNNKTTFEQITFQYFGYCGCFIYKPQTNVQDY